MEPDRLLHGRYRLVAPLARGGMAEVWEGVDDVLTRPIAVKVLHHHLGADEGFQERFRREAINAARLAHPNVVATFDTGEDEGAAFIVMELIRGRTLRQLLEDHGGALPAWLAREIGVQVADALHHAHDAGIVHRDVKPANILVCDADPGTPPQVKVADFGIARAAADDGADLTRPGTLLGTAKYLSPEQVEGREPTPRSDVYALGVVLYEALTGRPPFVADTELATAMAHVHTEPLTPRQLRAGIPRSIEAVVRKAMAKDPAQRYASAAELAGALRSLDLGDDAVPAVVHDPTPPAGVAPTFRQTERTWLVPAAVIVGIAVVLVVLGVVLSGTDVAPSILRRGGGDDAAAQPATPITITGSRSFDPPPGDGNEKDETVGAVRDGDPATEWATSQYKTREFGGLKEGLGVIVELNEAADLSKVTVTSPGGWSGRVYVSDAPGAALADWGEPASDDQNEVGGTATFDLRDGTRGRAVLLWFTRLAGDRRAAVGEITVEG